MIPSKLPARPSLESLRKQAKKLARDVAAGNTGAIARARAQLHKKAELPLSQRDAQLVLAREYGFAGWRDLLKEVNQRLGQEFGLGALEWAISEARRVIHDNKVEDLRQLLAEYPALLSWRANENDSGLLGMATWSFGDSGDAFAEEHYTRPACAEVLLDAGAVVVPSVCDDVIKSRARGLIDLFQRKGLFPRTLKFFAALGDVDSIRARLDTKADDLAAVNEALMYACHLRHASAAELLLDRSIALDVELGKNIEGGPGRSALGAVAVFCQTTDLARASRGRSDVVRRRTAARTMASVRRTGGIPGRADGNGGAQRSRRSHYRSFGARSRSASPPRAAAIVGR